MRWATSLAHIFSEVIFCFQRAGFASVIDGWTLDEKCLKLATNTSFEYFLITKLF